MVLGRIECLLRQYLRHDVRTSRIFLVKGVNGTFGDHLLFRRMADNQRAVLRTDIVSLAIWSRRIVDCKKDVEQRRIVDTRWIKMDLYHLSVPGIATAYVTVRWIGGFPAAITRQYGNNTVQSFENCFQAPEATAVSVWAKPSCNCRRDQVEAVEGDLICLATAQGSNSAT